MQIDTSTKVAVQTVYSGHGKSMIWGRTDNVQMRLYGGNIRQYFQEWKKYAFKVIFIFFMVYTYIHFGSMYTCWSRGQFTQTIPKDYPPQPSLCQSEHQYMGLINMTTKY